VKSLKKLFKKPVRLENDAAAAVLGERWKGGHGRVENILAMTLGTGVGIGVLANGVLVRAGQGLHPEAGHIPLDINAKDYPCGCGANGCIEAYLAGSHFSRRLGRLKNRALSGQEAVALAKDDVWVQEAFREYGRQLAQAVRTLSVLFAPEVVVISGGFSHAASLFLEETQSLLPTLMERYRIGVDLLPKIKVSKLQDDAGVLGAAYLALHK
jgi:glucokinase